MGGFCTLGLPFPQLEGEALLMGTRSQCFAAQENPISSVFQILFYLFSHIETQDLFSPQGGIFKAGSVWWGKCAGKNAVK